MFTQENYRADYKQTAAPYKAKSPIGGPPYRKLGIFGALSAKWSGPWRIVKFSPLALLVIQTTWLRITGRKEVCRGIMIDKLKPC